MTKSYKNKRKSGNTQKKRSFKFGGNEININTLLIIGLVVFMFYGGNQGWFKSDATISHTTNNILEGETLLETQETCTLSLSNSRICTGEYVTGRIVNGKNHNCYTFATGGTTWNLVNMDNTGNDGKISATEQINMVGDFTFRAICDVNDNGVFDNGDCITNTDNVVVEACAPPDIPPTYENGDIVGGTEGSLSLVPGAGGISFPIDLEDFPPTTGGPCKLQAKISTSWNYESPGACYGIQGAEGMRFALKDSEKEVWTRTDLGPNSIYNTLTYCGLQWDGSTPWVFTAEKLFNFQECGIILDYKVEVITCDCEI